MKRAGKIGRMGRAAIVAAVGVVFVLVTVPAANASFEWESDPAGNKPVNTVRHLPQPDSQIQFEWE